MTEKQITDKLITIGEACTRKHIGVLEELLREVVTANGAASGVTVKSDAEYSDLLQRLKRNVNAQALLLSMTIDAAKASREEINSILALREQAAEEERKKREESINREVRAAQNKKFRNSKKED